MADLPENTKILLAPTNYAGIAGYVVNALRKKGYEVDHLTYSYGQENPFGFSGGNIINLKQHGGRIEAQLDVIKQCLKKEYDIYHFWNHSLFFKTDYRQNSGIDLLLLKARGKKIIHRFTGYDLRLKAADKEINPYSAYYYGYEDRVDEKIKQARIDFLRQYCDGLLVQDPEMQQFCPEARIIPRALDLKKWTYVGIPDRGIDVPLIIHSSSVSSWKGTKFVLKAIEQLRSRDVKFEFKLIKNMPNHEAREWYKKADIIIDQILIGATGVTTIEGWALGKPVVNYIREDLFNPFYGQNTPVINANPDNLQEKLYIAIKDHEYRKELSERGRRLVEKFHDLDKVIEQYIQYYSEIFLKKQSIANGYADLQYLKIQSEEWGMDTRIANNARETIENLKRNRQYRERSTFKSKLRAYIRRNFISYRGNNVIKNYLARTFNIIEASLAFRSITSDFLRAHPFDLYLSHDVFASWAAFTLSRIYNGVFIADVVELPMLQERNGSEFRKITSLGSAIHNTIDRIILGRAYCTITVSDALGIWLDGNVKTRTHIVRNTRLPPREIRRDLLRKELGLSQNEIIIAQINTLGPVYGVESSIKAISELPENYVLVLIGRYMNEEYESRIRKLLKELRLEKRVFYMGFREADVLIELAAGANIGICILDDSTGNNRHALPNRLFDFIAARVPVIGTKTGDIGKIIDEYNIGVVIDSIDVEDIRKGVNKLLNTRNDIDYSKNLENAANSLSWEVDRDKFISVIEQSLERNNKKIPAKICLLARKKIDNNNRIIRQAAALSDRGHDVTVVALSYPTSALRVKCPRVKFHTVSASHVKWEMNRKRITDSF